MAVDSTFFKASIPKGLVCVNDERTTCAILNRGIKSEEVKIWDLMTNKVDAVVSLADLPAVTSIVFISSSGHKKSKSRQFVICGTNRGKMVVIDPAAGSVVSVLESCSSAITCICALKSGGFVTGFANGSLSFWKLANDTTCKLINSLQDLGTGPVTSLAHADPLLVIGQQSIVVYDLSLKSVTKTIAGHSSGSISDLSFCTDDSRIISCGHNDSSVLVWDVLGERSDPISSAVLSGTPSSLHSTSSVFATICNGAVVLASGIDVEARNKVRAIKNAKEISFSADAVCAIFFCPDDRILTIRGSLSIPVFEFLPVFVNGELNFGVLERESVTSSVTSESRKKKKARKGGEPEVISGVSAPLRHLPDSTPKQDVVVEDIVVPPGESAKSITNLLIQGLRANNPVLIESGLKLNEEQMIMESIERLPVSLVFPLLEQLVNRIVKKPARVVQLAPWIRCLHLAHGEHIRSNTQYKTVMKPLQDCIALYTESYPLLLKLKAKVEMMMARQAYEASKTQLGINQAEDFVAYEDNESEVEDQDFDKIPDLVSYASPMEVVDGEASDDSD